MRFINFFLIIIYLFKIESAYCQPHSGIVPEKSSIECLYRLTYQLDSTVNTKRTELMRLRIGSTLSCFESLDALKRDSAISALVASANMQVNLANPVHINASSIPVSNFRSIIYKIPAENKLFVYDKIGVVTYVYQEPNSYFSWQITPALATVSGYSCQRAVTVFAGRIWEAWFTREVPVADGPYKFSGLPGLIIKISDTKQYYTFELTKLERLQNTAVVSLPKYLAKGISKTDFVREKARYELTRTEQLASEGLFQNQSPEKIEETRKEYLIKLRKKNNYIELR